MTKQTSFPKNKIKILLLENVHAVAVKKLVDSGYAVESVNSSLGTEELMGAIKDVHVLGIRSKTKVTGDHLKNAQRLLAVGCFGVGTNQVALDDATTLGIPVFNAPYGNTRSVAELTIGHIITLARKAGDGNRKMHEGMWEKSAKGCYEVRDKVLGIVGYGHIGQQVSILAELLGLRVVFFDLLPQLPLGNSRQVETLDKLLAEADFVSLHVPATRSGTALIGKNELAKMKKGSYLLNTSRGTLIDFAALKEAVESGHLAGAAIDVYPAEPKSNKEAFHCDLAGVPNIVLTPHLGGSTEEAQLKIGQELAGTFIKFIDEGATVGAVNFPKVSMPLDENSHRILNVHKNVPGVLKDINSIISNLGANINGQFLSTYKNVGYLIMDVGKEVSHEVKEQISALDSNIRTRILW
jgi:D-3-phosphoglycerate dehydrogenase / 2-oxoglutarate reductase